MATIAPAIPKEPKVFSIHGASPELLAYSMAKYSRSALSLEQAMAELSSQKAASFMNQFYFQYGHRSIGDMAHIPMAIENISLLAAIEVIDEQRWDGQERSTRYQEFDGSEYFVPELADGAHGDSDIYHHRIAALFNGYHSVFEDTLRNFRQQHPKPENMEDAAYERTLRARAFDVARYMLPLATLTSVGQITSARTLESQISRLLASPHNEVRLIAERMKHAATSPAFKPGTTKIKELAGKLHELSTYRPDWWELYSTSSELSRLIQDDVIPAPTLLKYADPDSYRQESAAVIREYVEKAGPSASSPGEPAVPSVNCTLMPRLLPANFDPEVEVLATAVYQETDLSFRQCLVMVLLSGKSWRNDFMRDLLAIRGKHDEMLRVFRGGELIFDIQMDIGGMRDMHRHRRCTQIAQKFTADHFVTPDYISPEALEIYQQECGMARTAFDLLSEDSPGAEVYILPLGTMCRFLMKMDVAEACYIAELRTPVAGHISYRRVAYRIFEGVKQHYPVIAAAIENRVVHPDAPMNFFKR